MGDVGAVWFERSVPGRFHCLGEPHLADHQSQESAEMVQSSLCSEALRHKLSPGSNMLKTNAHSNQISFIRVVPNHNIGHLRALYIVISRHYNTEAARWHGG